MKIKPLRILTLILCSFSFSSCDLFNGGDKPKTEVEKLPPLTQTGENTFGYLVNGKAIVVTNTARITAIYQLGNLQLGGGVQDSKWDVDITIFPPFNPLEESVSYDIDGYAQFYNFQDDCYYELDDAYEGHIIFSKIDITNYIISGTFEFSTVTMGCDTVRITDGRFDVQYIP